MAEAEVGTDALETLAGAGCMLVVTPCVRRELGQRYSADSLELALQCQIGEVVGGKMSLLDNMRKAKGEKVRVDARFAELTASADTVLVCFDLEQDKMRFTADRKVNIISEFFVLPVDASSPSTQIAGDANVCAGKKGKGECYYLEVGEMGGLICVLDSDPARRALQACQSVQHKK
jgi:hypothetical protein